MLLSRVVLAACLKVLAALCLFIAALFAIWALVYRFRDGASELLAMQVISILGFGAAGLVCRWLAGRIEPGEQRN